MLTRQALALALWLTACAPTPAPTAAPAPVAAGGERGVVAAEAAPPSSATAAPGAAEPTSRPTFQASAGEPAYLGVIDRTGLVAIIDRGLGHVLARFKLSPVMAKGKFQGFRVDAIDPAWAAAGIAVNDVLLRLNGRPIERPEQALVAFESLRVASELALELARDGQKRALRYRIEARSPTSSASAPP